MPNKPATPKFGVRVPPDLWAAAKRAAHDRGETLTEVIRRALREYVETWPGDHS